jgi:hypothetical protein
MDINDFSKHRITRNLVFLICRLTGVGKLLRMPLSILRAEEKIKYPKMYNDKMG